MNRDDMMRYSKYRIINTKPFRDMDLIMLQEIGDAGAEFLNNIGSSDGTWYTRKRGNAGWRGGVAIGVNPTNVIIIKPVGEDYDMGVDTKGVLIQLGNDLVWVYNIYRVPNSPIRDFKQRMNSVIEKIFGCVKNPAIIIGGDFNFSQSSTLQSIRSGVEDRFGMKVYVPRRGTCYIRAIDSYSNPDGYIYTPGRITLIQEDMLMNKWVDLASTMSDHRPVACSFSVKPGDGICTSRVIRVSNKSNARKHARRFMKLLLDNGCLNHQTMNPSSFVRSVDKSIAKVYESKIFQVRSVTWNNKIRKKEAAHARLRLDPDLLRFGITSFLEDSERLVNGGGDENQYKSPDSREAWKAIKRLCGINSSMGLRMATMMKIVHPVNGASAITNDDDAISESVIRRLIELQGQGSTFYDMNMRVDFPMTPYQVRGILNRWQSGKSISYDGWSDEMFNAEYWKSPESQELLRRLWKIPLGSIPARHFVCRMIAINKVFPAAPLPSQIRPIAIPSPLIKFMESRFIPDFNDWMERFMHLSQVGFVPKRSTQLNLLRLLGRGKTYLSRPSTHGHYCILFIDFSNAYNTVNRQLLWHIAANETRNLFIPRSFLAWIGALQDRMAYQCGKYLTRTSSGLAQGSLLSPALFNVYVNHLLNILTSTRPNHGFRLDYEDIFMYADDLAIIMPTSYVHNFIPQFSNLCSSNYNLHMNYSKCGILQLTKNEEKREFDVGTKIHDVPIVCEYKYLGITFDEALTIRPHLRVLNQKLNFITMKIRSTPNTTPELRRILWNGFARPHAEYAAPLLCAQRRCDVDAFIVLIKKSFKLCLGFHPRTPSRLISLFMGDLIAFGSHRASKIINDFSSRYPGSLSFAAKRVSPETLQLPPIRAQSLNGIPENLMSLWRDLGFAYCKVCGVGTHLTVEHLKEQHKVDLDFNLIDEVNKCLGNKSHHEDYCKIKSVIASWRLVKLKRCG
jgi:hypothetical protein